LGLVRLPRHAAVLVPLLLLLPLSLRVLLQLQLLLLLLLLLRHVALRAVVAL
jgi:hypothetical protein